MKSNYKWNILIPGFCVLLLCACRKEDKIAPVITINGSVPTYHSLNQKYVDQGATAYDNSDVNSDWVYSDATVKNPNVNQTGRYTITYTSTDQSGNEAKAQRVVYVKNDADFLANTYSVVDSSGGIGHIPYLQKITFSQNKNNRIHFSKFAGYEGNSGIYADVLNGGTTFDIPLQTVTGIGPNAEDHKFSGTGYIDGTSIKINYLDTKLPSGAAVNGVAYFTKQ